MVPGRTFVVYLYRCRVVLSYSGYSPLPAGKGAGRLPDHFLSSDAQQELLWPSLMPRRPRIHAPGAFYHITLRGNHQQSIFFRDSDRDLLDRIVAESLEQLAARLHAYCWMTNHLHMLVQVSDEPLGRLMLRIASMYARAVQRRIKTTGHLFERRYHASLLDADNYLLAVVRYIHLNPVVAGLARSPADYRWSSHRTYLRLQHQTWVTTRFVMERLALRPDDALRGYQQLISGPDQAEWGAGALAPHAEHPQVIGDDAFVTRILNCERKPGPRKSLEQLVDECCERFQVSREQLISRHRARDLVLARAWLSREATSGRIASVSAVARLLERSEGAMRHMMRRHLPAP